MPYSLEYTDAAESDLSLLDARAAQQIRAALERMAENAEVVRHVALTGPLSGQFRLRTRRYRSIYLLDRDNRRVIVLRVHHRRGAYRG